MRRRTLVFGGITSTAVAALGGAVPPDVSAVGRVGLTDVQTLQRATQRLYSLDYQHGGDGLWQAAAAQVRNAYAMLEHGSYGETVGQQLLRAASRMQMCQGWLAFDAGKLDVARTCYTEALALARQAGDAEVETHALANLAFQANVLGRPREATRFADGAARAAAAAGELPRLSMVPQLRQAISSALDQDASASDHAVTHARTVFDREADQPTAEWCAFLGPAELDGIEGTAAIELNRLARAEQLLESAITGYADRYARNRALYRVRLARARLRGNVIDGAAQSATAAVDDLAGTVASWRVATELNAVAQGLAGFPHVPEVATFMTRYAELAS